MHYSVIVRNQKQSNVVKLHDSSTGDPKSYRKQSYAVQSHDSSTGDLKSY
jgi:hypothetical protein